MNLGPNLPQKLAYEGRIVQDHIRRSNHPFTTDKGESTLTLYLLIRNPKFAYV